MIGSFIFTEMSPSAAGTTVSSQPVSSSNIAGNGIAAPLDDAEAIDIAVDMVGATGGTLDLYVQSSPDGGVNWYDIVHFPQLTAGAPAIKYQAPLSLFTNSTAPVQVGKNLLPALAAGAIVQGAFSDRLRLVMVAGSGTTLGALVRMTVGTQRQSPRN